MHTQHQVRQALGFRWDGVVTLGNVITLLGMLGSMIAMGGAFLVWGTRLEARVEREADLRRAFEIDMRREQERDSRAFENIQTELRRQGIETRAALDRLADKIDRKQDR